MICLNAQSLLAHIDEIKHFIGSNCIEILSLTETRITPEINDFEIKIDGYSNTRCNSDNRYTGGVICYVLDDINYEVKMNVSIENMLWLLAISIRKYLIVIVYRSPSSSIADFLKNLEKIMDDVLALNSENLYVMGDLNIDLSQNSFYREKLLKLMRNAGLNQKVQDYTRITENSKTIIDLVFTNDKEAKIAVKRTPKITDHDIISVTVENKNQTREPNNETYKSRDIKRIKETNIGEILIKKKWSNGDVNHMLDVYYNNIIEVINEIAPIQIRQTKYSVNKWFDDETNSLIKRRNVAYEKACLQDTDINWSMYKELRNSVTTLIRRKKKAYYENLIDENKNDSKLMWKAIKEVVGKQNKGNTISRIYFGNLLVTDRVEIAEKFNEFFVASVEEIVNGTDSEEQQLEINQPSSQLTTFKHISQTDIERIVQTLKKDNSIDNIDKNIIKSGMAVIGRELAKIINKSIDEGEVPKIWKGSIVVPVPKVVSTKKSEEHRPINTLPISEKVMEIHIKEQLLSHVNSNNILIENQSGFRDKHSCETSIQLVVSKWKELLDHGKTVLTVFIDFKRAFETINRDLLIVKLRKYGIIDNANKWLVSYLTDRYQQTKIGDIISSKKVVKLGVPQGTVLGPLLFILYVNNIVSCLDQNTIINLFADDTAITVYGDGIEEVLVKMQVELKKLEKWLLSNSLIVNTQKTKVMLFNKSDVQNINNLQLFGEDLQYVNECKYLGLIIDNELKFNKHASYVIDKVNKKINYFRRISNNLSMYSRVTVYKTIIAPHFEYCPTIMLYLNETEKSTLQKLQNRAIRIILKVNHYARISDMLDCLQFMNINQRMIYHNLLFIFKMVHKMLPKYMCDKITFVSDIHNYNTRNANNIFVLTAKKSRTLNSLFYKGLILYNSLPAHLKDINNVNIFKRNISNYVKSHF